MMKKITRFFMLIGIISMAMSCQKEDSLPADNSTMGKISLSREIIGTRQSVELSCPVNISPNATGVEIKWEDDHGITAAPDKYENGIAYITMSWSTAGEFIAKCKVRYIYGNAEVKELEVPVTVVVHPSDFKSSFFGDSYETVVKDNPNGTQNHKNTYTLAEVGGLFHYFEFVDGKLNSGKTGQFKKNSVNPTPKACYTFFGSEFRSQENAHKQFSPTSVYKVTRREPIVPFTPTNEQQRVIDQFQTGTLLTDTERVIIGEMVDNKILCLNATLTWKNRKTETRTVTVSCWATDPANEYALLTAFGRQ